MSPLVRSVPVLGVCLMIGAVAMAQEPTSSTNAQPTWDTFSDTWLATDALGRQVATADEVGPPRPDRWVGMFYFLWNGAHVNGGPWDVTRILDMDPEAMEKPDSPLWGPMTAFHHWGESIFGHYVGDDRWVLRKHAQLLADAGVDVLIFDVTNKVTYEHNYTALFEVLTEVRAQGARTPQVAFLTPFWDPESTVAELYDALYSKGLFRDLWFEWDGKPLILADPERVGNFGGSKPFNTPVALGAGQTLGQSFTTESAARSVGVSTPTWESTTSSVTLTLHRDGPGGEAIASRVFENVADSGWIALTPDAAIEPGAYYLEMSAASGEVGWWSHSDDVYPDGQAFADGAPTGGDRAFRLVLADDAGKGISDFFTFRKPQASYFVGPTGPDMWSWLEVYPQHVFYNSKGEKEQMSVGVAQNAVHDPEAPPIGDFEGLRIGAMSEPGSLGRSYHDGKPDPDPDAVLYGLNFAEQWERALQEDPRLVFVTGWNEWIASRYDEFAGTRRPVMFVDTFDQETSRDIEPMEGGHSDNYYYQMVDYIRRYKGARALPLASSAKSIDLAAGFEQWADVGPEYRDAIGDTAHRDHPGYATATHYTDTTGRNDLMLMKVARDQGNLYFYAKTRDPITPCTDTDWMVLFVNTNGDADTGWEGYDFAINRRIEAEGTAIVEYTDNGWNWISRGAASFVVAGDELMLAVPRELLGLTGDSIDFTFKWADNCRCDGAIDAFTLHGDCAPPGRFSFRYRAEE